MMPAILQRRYKCFYKKAGYIASFGNIKNLRDFEDKYMENPKKRKVPASKNSQNNKLKKGIIILTFFGYYTKRQRWSCSTPSQLQQNLHKILNQLFNQSRLLKINWNQNKVMLSGFRSD
jgi:hypothetical protein